MQAHDSPRPTAPLALSDLPSLTCSVCLDVFDDPVLLPGCGHSLCRACAEASRSLGCPNCRAGIADGPLVPNVALRSLLEDICVQTKQVACAHLRSWRLLHFGSHARVHRAEHLGERVAVKEFGTAGSAARARVAAELAALSALGPHPHVVPLVGSCVSPRGRTLVVTRFLPGRSLHDRAVLWKPSPGMAFLLTALREAALGLAHVHEHGVLHGDVRSKNVMFDGEGRARLVDFAQSGSRGAIAAAGGIAAPEHAAPEVLRGGHCDASADVYSLGMTVWEALAGADPFAECEGSALAKQRVLEGRRPAVPAEWPASVRTLIAQCWGEDQHSRPSAGQAAAALLPAAAEATRSQIEEWLEREKTVSGGACPGCSASETSPCCCSVCTEALQGLLLSKTVPPKTKVFATVSVAAMHEAASMVREKAEPTEILGRSRRALVERLDRVVQPLSMPSDVFARLLRTLYAAPAAPCAEELARLLSDLGHPTMSAAQSRIIWGVLRSRGGALGYGLCHVLYSRVVDQWRLTPKAHEAGHRFYGYRDAGDLRRISRPTDAETLGAALCELRARSLRFPRESLWDADTAGFLAGQIRARGLADAFDAHRVRRGFPVF